VHGFTKMSVGLAVTKNFGNIALTENCSGFSAEGNTEKHRVFYVFVGLLLRGGFGAWGNRLFYRRL